MCPTGSRPGGQRLLDPDRPSPTTRTDWKTVFPGQRPQNEYKNFVERALPYVTACLYHRINDLSFLRHAGAQLHSAGGLFFLRMAWDALRDFFPIDCGWLRGMALVVLDFAWHGIGDWRRGTYYQDADIIGWDA